MSLSTSFALAQAANEAMTDESVKTTALMLMEVYNQLDPESFREALFAFSANLTSVTASLITQVFMTEEQIEEMITEAYALRDLGDAIENE